MSETMTKVCTGPCEQVLPLERFHVRSDATDGRHAACRECRSAIAKAQYVPKPPRPAFTGTEKACTGCGEVKALERFHKSKGGPGGRRSHCRSCVSEYHRANRERGREGTRAYRERGGEQVRGRERERGRDYHAENRDRILEQKRARHAARPHVQWENDYRKRARAAGCIPVVRTFTREELVAHWGNGERCVYCDGPFQEIEHLYPVSLGGVHAVETVAPSCSRCNQAGGRDVRRFLRELTEQERYVQVIVSAARARLAPIA